MTATLLCVATACDNEHARQEPSAPDAAAAPVGATPILTSGSQRLTMPTTPGTYPYQCAVHGAAMRGTVIVP